jgi:hypothetical protein
VGAGSRNLYIFTSGFKIEAGLLPSSVFPVIYARMGLLRLRFLRTTTMAAPQTFRIQELCDHIVSYIVLDSNYTDIFLEASVGHVDTAVKLASQDALKSIALVCDTLRKSAQAELFRHIILNPRDLPGIMILLAETALEGATSALGRLSAITTESPHLSRLIRSISILADSQVLKPLYSMHIPLLRKIRLGFRDMQLHDRPALQFARDIVGLPSIREVELVGTNYELNLDDFASVFEACNRQLCSVSLHGIYFIDSGIFASIPSTICLSRPRPRRCQIQTLRINNADQLGDWLISPCCPFDFSQLLNLEVSILRIFPTLIPPNLSPLKLLLSSAGLTLKRLAIFGGELSAS